MSPRKSTKSPPPATEPPATAVAATAPAEAHAAADPAPVETRVVVQAETPAQAQAILQSIRDAQPAAAAEPGPELSVVIPCYNEEAILWASVTELHAGLLAMGRPFEIIVSENGSKDDTRAIADKLSRAFPEVRAITSDEPNYGKALRRGIEAARGTYVLCEEIDLCDLAFHRRALEILDAGRADMVVGSKAHPEAKDERPMTRRAATMVINGMLRVLLGFRGTDTHGLKAFRRDALQFTVSKCVVDRDLFASELVIRAQRHDVRVTEIPIIIHEKRPPSIHLFKRVPNVLKNLARLVYVIRIANR
ncbi:MAG: glycosyltransferase [Deltaproteobacteria bacterium]|nr:glycosyltransferase [Deltaproteobacteria bacterium]